MAGRIRYPSMSLPPEAAGKKDVGLSATVYPVAPKNKDTAPFRYLSALFDKLSTERKHDKRRKLLEAWFNRWREQCGKDLYPVLRLILPQKDRERTMYGLKEKMIAKAYIKLIPLGAKDPDAVRLLNWKRPTEKDRTSGDFPTVLYEVIAKRSSVMEGTLSIQQLNDILDELSLNSKNQEAQSLILQRVYSSTTPEEQRWIARIILRDMTISVKETTVFSVFHPDAHDLFNTCSDLKKVAWELADPNRRLNADDKTIQLFHAFAPMLCKRPIPHVEEMIKELNAPGQFIIEEKLDGERMQLHKRGNEYYFCSRKGKDYTYLYGKHVGVGSLTPYIDSAFDERVEEIILDGEMLVWDPVSERNLPFGTLKTAALDRSKKEHNPRPCFKVFDLLFLNGMSLIHKPLKMRKRNMRTVLTEITGRIEFITESEGRTAKDIRDRMEDIMENRGEGLILKHPSAEYVLNGRNKDWIKVKPEYMDNMGETVDVLVVAGNYGTGRRSGGVSALICAVLDDRRRVDEDDELKYSTFIRVGSGMSFADYVEIRSRRWKEYNYANPRERPSWLLASEKGIISEDKGDCYLEPEDSFIISVKAAEITPSANYHMGFTMRFPRCVGIRTDLGIEDCMKASEVFEMLRTIRKRKAEEATDGGKKKKAKSSKLKGPAPSMSSAYKGLKIQPEEVESNIFESMRIVVISDPKSKTGAADRTALLRIVLVNGGQIGNVVTQPTDTVVYCGSTIPYDVKRLIERDVHDILKPQWIHECVTRGDLVDLQPRHFFHATEARRAELGMEEHDTDDDEDDKGKEEDEEQSLRLRDEIAMPPPPLPSGTTTSPVAKIEELDIDTSAWFHVPSASNSRRDETGPDTEGSVTEDDSDNDDVKEENDDWDHLPPSQTLGSDYEIVDEKVGQDEVAAVDNTAIKDEDAKTSAKMGETDDDMHYDTDLIFKHLCFYLDTPENARKNSMPVKAKHEVEIKDSFETIMGTITKNGGRIGNIDDPKLTHVLLDKRDISRRRELSSRTSQPKRRYMVLTDFITACLEEETLLDESGFAP